MADTRTLLAQILQGPARARPWGVPASALDTTMTNPVGTSRVFPPQVLTNPSPAFSPMIGPADMTRDQLLGAMTTRGERGRPPLASDLPAMDAAGQQFFDNAVSWAGMTTPIVKGIRAYHGSPHRFDQFDPESAATWFSTNEATAKNFGKDRMPGVGINNPRFGGKANVWRDAKPNMYEANIAAENLQTIDPMKEARKIAKEIGAPRPKTWDDAAEILQWGRAQEMWIDEAKAAGKSGVLFKNVGDDPMGLVSDHVAVLDTKIIEILRRYGLLGMLGGGAAATATQGDQ
jgi:hypothetical protein